MWSLRECDVASSYPTNKYLALVNVLSFTSSLAVGLLKKRSSVEYPPGGYLVLYAYMPKDALVR